LFFFFHESTPIIDENINKKFDNYKDMQKDKITKDINLLINNNNIKN
jgi:hypothetical protein